MAARRTMPDPWQTPKTSCGDVDSSVDKLDPETVFFFSAGAKYGVWSEKPCEERWVEDGWREVVWGGGGSGGG